MIFMPFESQYATSYSSISLYLATIERTDLQGHPRLMIFMLFESHFLLLINSNPDLMRYGQFSVEKRA